MKFFNLLYFYIKSLNNLSILGKIIIKRVYMEITEAFIRQRRNLLLTSIVLFLINFAGIEIPNKLTIATNQYDISDPIIIYMFIWTILFYFLWRYMQFFFNLSQNHVDYGFLNYSINHQEDDLFFNFKDINVYIFFVMIWRLIKFLINIFSKLFSIAISIIFHKNVTETLLPIVFAIFVIISSYNSTYYKNKEPEIIKKLEIVKSKIWSEHILKIELEINKYLN